VPTDRRLPSGSVAYTGCGTSFHAAQTGGFALEALEAVLAPPAVDTLVVVSHEGETPLSLEAARAFGGRKVLVTGAPGSPLAEMCDEVVVATPEIERSWCHTVSYTCAVEPVSDHERWLIVGAGREWPTAQEAALKLREGVYVAAEAYHTEELLHGHLAAIDERVRCFVLEGERRAAERAREAARALEALGCDVKLVPTTHPVVGVVRFQLLTIDLAEARGTNPDLIRRDDPRWERARATYR
jgi:glucosamine 6-phosphate synthetase-like amidotransferase/phosphosugar isomerase protein